MSTAWGERLVMLHDARKRLYELPCDQLFELPGRPNVIYAIKNYTHDRAAGAAECRADIPFLFKAFETGQIGPRRLSRLVGENKPRNATIHEYLDWTVTGVEAEREGEYDFSGFRLLVLLQRERIMWPAPGQFDKPEKKKHPQLGAPLDPIPALQVKGKPLSAATIRTGPDYIEVPFVATHENKRGRGFGRCVVEAVEEIARALGIPKLLLCSTCETSVASTWRHLGFKETSEQQLAAWDVEDADLVHMQNTLQMHKEVPPPRAWRPLVIRHHAFVARVYMPADKQALSSKSCVARPGMHDMGAISGFGKSSRATSAATNGSLSNASFGGTAEQQGGDGDSDGGANGATGQAQEQQSQPVAAAPAPGPGQQPDQQPQPQLQPPTPPPPPPQQQPYAPAPELALAQPQQAQQVLPLLPSQPQQPQQPQQQQPQQPPQQQQQQQSDNDAALLGANPAAANAAAELFAGADGHGAAPMEAG